MEQRDRISQAVGEYVERNSYLIPDQHLNEKDLDHIINIGTSIMCTKWEVGFPGGSFVQSINNNDLMGAVNSADDVCGNCLKFFVVLHYNLGYVN
jgi:hypothetical protein